MSGGVDEHELPGVAPEEGDTARPASDVVRRKAARMAEARGAARSFWQQVARIGAFGWLVVLPVAAGAIGGRFLARWTGHKSLALAGIFLGLVIGAWVAWRQIRQSIEEQP